MTGGAAPVETAYNGPVHWKRAGAESPGGLASLTRQHIVGNTIQSLLPREVHKVHLCDLLYFNLFIMIKEFNLWLFLKTIWINEIKLLNVFEKGGKNNDNIYDMT